jgi:hypothetical protein
MRKEKTIICQECKIPFQTKWNNKFCGHHCSAISSNRNRLPPTEETKRKQSAGLLKYYSEHPEKAKRGKEHSEFVGSFTKGKYKGRAIVSILSASKRTVSKLLKRLDIGCCICGWKEAPCDIHHINGRKVDNADEHWNLTCVCPNHHRMAHNKKVSNDKLISLDKYLPENWRDFYYG